MATFTNHLLRHHRSISPSPISILKRYASQTTAPFAFKPDAATLTLDDEATEFKSYCYEFAQRFVAPLAESTDKNNTFPNDLWRIMGEHGLLGITAPEEYGGLDKGYLYHCLALEEISRCSGSIGLSYAAHSNLCVNQLVINGTKQQKDKYLSKLVSGEYIGALAMSENGAGSDVVSMKCKANKSDTGYIINGPLFIIHMHIPICI